MFEKVNPSHPDKIADRIAGALVDLAYKKEANPKIAVEVLIGHKSCRIIAETSVHFDTAEVLNTVYRITGTNDINIDFDEVCQDPILAGNQSKELRCGDNGIFCGFETNAEEYALTKIAKDIYNKYPTDGKYILAYNDLIICQSNASTEELQKQYKYAWINPLGDWTGGTDVDTGATNRKLGSDMGRAVTGGGLHGKDLSKADVSVNIYAHLKAQKTHEPVKLYCAIGDAVVDGKKYSEIVEIARDYINKIGGFEKFAEWGLINASE